MAKFKNENGEEFEAFTKEEVDALIKEKDDKISAFEIDLQKEKDKDKNFSQLKETYDKKINDLTNEITTFKNSSINNVKSNLLSKLSGGDEEVKKKIEFEYGQFQGEALSEAEISDRMFKAFKLAVPDINPSTLEDAFSKVGSRTKKDVGQDPKTPNENEIKIGNALGITEEDRKKYGTQVNN